MEKILLVEDDPSIAETLRLNLKLNGYEMVHVGTIKAAKKAVLGGAFALILLDVNLSDGNGFEFCDELREAGLDLPVIMLTARSDEESAVKGLSKGATDYVRKPFGTNELMARIKRLTNRTVTGDKILSFGDLHINRADRRALFSERELVLTRREFDILVFLVKRSGAPVSRAELLDLLDEDGDMNDRTLDSHISNLRNKLKLNGEQAPRITAVYGIGYKID